MNIDERFDARWTPEPMSGCFLWFGMTSKTGYGQFHTPGRVVYAHRFAYERAFGEIPKGLVIDHLCRNRGCVNPDHMEPVSIGENTLRGETIASQNKKKTHCLRGHELTIENIYTRKDRGGKCRDCRECHRIRRKKYGLLAAGVVGGYLAGKK